MIIYMLQDFESQFIKCLISSPLLDTSERLGVIVWAQVGLQERKENHFSLLQSCIEPLNTEQQRKPAGGGGRLPRTKPAYLPLSAHTQGEKDIELKISQS